MAFRASESLIGAPEARLEVQRPGWRPEDLAGGPEAWLEAQKPGWSPGGLDGGSEAWLEAHEIWFRRDGQT